MLDGAAIDVAIGLLLVFLIVSVMASAIVEVVGGFFHRRAKNLWDTIDILLGRTRISDGGPERRLVDALYRQPFITGLVRPSDRVFYDPGVPASEMGTQRSAAPNDGHGQASRITAAARPSGRTFSEADAATGRTEGSRLSKPLRASSELKGDPAAKARRYYGPQHIDAREFANALIEVIRPGGTADEQKHGLVSAIDAMPAGELRTKLLTLVSQAGDALSDARSSIETWYEEQMTAVSHWYRKQTRWFLFIAGLALAVSMNVDSFHVATTLYQDDELRGAVVDQAETLITATCNLMPSSTTIPPGTPEAEQAAVENVECIQNALDDSVALPIGWVDVDTDADTWPVRGAGWILVGAAATLGGPFWWDLLGRVLRDKQARSPG